MKIEKCVKEAFVVIGKEGSTMDDPDFVQQLWLEVNSHFSEVQPFAKKDEDGNLVGIWGAISDFSHSYKPWEDHFSKGMYFAGVECMADAEAPDGWTKWIPLASVKRCGQRCFCTSACSELLRFRQYRWPAGAMRVCAEHG